MSANAIDNFTAINLVEFFSFNPAIAVNSASIDSQLYMGKESRSPFVRKMNKSTWFQVGEQQVISSTVQPATSTSTTTVDGLAIADPGLGTATYSLFGGCNFGLTYDFLLGFWLRWRTPRLILNNVAEPTPIVTTTDPAGVILPAPAELFYYIGGTSPGVDTTGPTSLPPVGIAGVVYIGTREDLLAFTIPPAILDAGTFTSSGIIPLISYTPLFRIAWTQNLFHNLVPYMSFRSSGNRLGAIESYDTVALDNFMQFRIPEGQYETYSNGIGNVRELLIPVTSAVGSATPTFIDSMDLRMPTPFSFSRAQLFGAMQQDDFGDASTAFPTVLLGDNDYLAINIQIRDWRRLLYIERQVMSVPAGFNFPISGPAIVPNVSAFRVAAVVSNTILVAYNANVGNGVLTIPVTNASGTTAPVIIAAQGTNLGASTTGITLGSLGIEFVAPGVEGEFYPITRLEADTAVTPAISSGISSTIFPIPEVINYSDFFTIANEAPIDQITGYVIYSNIMKVEKIAIRKGCTERKRLYDTTITYSNSSIIAPGTSSTVSITNVASLSSIRGLFINNLNVTSALRGLWSNYSNVGIRLRDAEIIDPSIYAEHIYYPIETDRNRYDSISAIAISYSGIGTKVSMPAWYYNSITSMYTSRQSPKAIGYHWYPINCLGMWSLDPNGSLGTLFAPNIDVAISSRGSYIYEVDFVDDPFCVVGGVPVATTYAYQPLVVLLIWRVATFSAWKRCKNGGGCCDVTYF